MNCCDEYGDCQQGRDCPVRKQKAIEYQTGWSRLDNFLNAVAYGATILGAVAFTLLLSWACWYALRAWITPLPPIK